MAGLLRLKWLGDEGWDASRLHSVDGRGRFSVRQVYDAELFSAKREVPDMALLCPADGDADDLVGLARGTWLLARGGEREDDQAPTA